MTQTEIDFSKGASNPMSQIASSRVNRRGARYEVWRIIQLAGKAGITCEQVAEKMGKYPHQISGRFKELITMGAIFIKSEDGVTKAGNPCAIYIA